MSFLSGSRPLFYPPDSKAELSVDGGGVGGVEKDGDRPGSVLPYFLFPIGETFQLPGSFYSLHLHLEDRFIRNNFNIHQSVIESGYLESVTC